MSHLGLRLVEEYLNGVLLFVIYRDKTMVMMTNIKSTAEKEFNKLLLNTGGNILVL
jgi:hypothetical protein